MLRRLFTIMAAISLLLCLGVCAMWARSFYVPDQREWLGWNLYQACSYCGSIQLRRYSCESAPGKMVGWPANDPRYHDPTIQAILADIGPGLVDLVPLQPFVPAPFTNADRLSELPWQFPDYRFQSTSHWIRWYDTAEDHMMAGHRLDRIHDRSLFVPYWLIAACLLPLPALWLFRRLRALRRASPFSCRTCGYDLRATPERCPECGSKPRPV